jgi:hypothetical protein
MNSPVERLTKKDADICRAFRSIILKGKYDIHGEAVRQAGLLFSWFSDLDKRIEETLKPFPPPNPPKPMEGEF